MNFWNLLFIIIFHIWIYCFSSTIMNFFFVITFCLLAKKDLVSMLPDAIIEGVLYPYARILQKLCFIFNLRNITLSLFFFVFLLIIILLIPFLLIYSKYIEIFHLFFFLAPILVRNKFI